MNFLNFNSYNVLDYFINYVSSKKHLKGGYFISVHKNNNCYINERTFVIFYIYRMCVCVCVRAHARACMCVYVYAYF